MNALLSLETINKLQIQAGQQHPRVHVLKCGTRQPCRLVILTPGAHSYRTTFHIHQKTMHGRNPFVQPTFSYFPFFINFSTAKMCKCIVSPTIASDRDVLLHSNKECLFLLNLKNENSDPAYLQRYIHSIHHDCFCNIVTFKLMLRQMQNMTKLFSSHDLQTSYITKNCKKNYKKLNYTACIPIYIYIHTNDE